MWWGDKMEHNRDILEMMDLIVSNNTPEQIKEAEELAGIYPSEPCSDPEQGAGEALPDKDAVQENSFALLRQYLDTLAEAKP